MLPSSLPHAPGSDDQKSVEAVSVMGQHVFEARRGESKAVGGKTQVNDTRVRLAMAKDELPKITIIGDEDASLPLRDGQHLLIGQARGMVTADPLRIVTALCEPSSKTGIRALVEEKVHKAVGGAVPFLCPTTVRA